MMTGAGSQVRGIERRSVLLAALGTTLLPVGLVPMAQAARVPKLEVWQDPNCGCCEGWVAHMQTAGFDVTTHHVANVVPIKTMSGVPEALWSCHTALVDGYLIEGHVPAADVRRLLAERPRAKGLSAPGMPPSSPGMDIPGTPYEVILFVAPDGERVWARH